MYAEGVTVRADGSIISILNRDRMMIAVGMHSPLNGGYYLFFSLNRSKSAPPSPIKVIKKVLNLNGNLSDWFVFSPICPFYWNGYGHCSPEAIEKQQSLGATQNFPRNERKKHFTFNRTKGIQFEFVLCLFIPLTRKVSFKWNYVIPFEIKTTGKEEESRKLFPIQQFQEMENKAK